MKTLILSPKRLLHFLLRQASLTIQGSLIGITAIFGILLLISLMTAYFNPQSITGLTSLYSIVFVISGIVYTSRIFQELNTPEKAYSFLTLPASTLEKTVGSWLLSSPLFILVFLSFTSLVFGMTTWVAHDVSALGALFNKHTLRIIGGYMLVQTIFFLGACTFKKNNLLKTLLSLFLISVGLIFFVSVCGWFLLRGNVMDFSFSFESGSFSGLGKAEIVHDIFVALLGPFLLIVSYFKLKEREV